MVDLVLQSKIIRETMQKPLTIGTIPCKNQSKPLTLWFDSPDGPILVPSHLTGRFREVEVMARQLGELVWQHDVPPPDFSAASQSGRKGGKEENHGEWRTNAGRGGLSEVTRGFPRGDS